MKENQSTTLSIKATLTHGNALFENEYIFNCVDKSIIMVTNFGEDETTKAVSFDELPSHIKQAFDIMLDK